jgi:hypothetical protein
MNLLDRFSKNTQMQNFMKIRRVGAVFVHGNRRGDGRNNGDMTKLIFALRNFSITPNNSTDATPTCFGKNVSSSGNTCANSKWYYGLWNFVNIISPGRLILEHVIPEGDISSPKQVRVVSLLSICTWCRAFGWLYETDILKQVRFTSRLLYPRHSLVAR